MEQDLDGDGSLEQTYLPVFDVLGNLAELRREDGTLVERYEYSPFGERRVIPAGTEPCDWTETSATGNRFGFHGLFEDDETGLLYARNRFFDPEMGRFVSMDPLGYVDGPNAYAYGMNSPANYSDPMGLCVLGVRCRDLGGFYQDVQSGIARDAGSMVLGAADLFTVGAISDVRSRTDAFFSTPGSFSERAAAAQAIGQGPRLHTLSLGFYGAEDKLDHLAHLVGVAQIRQAGTLLGTAVATGNWDYALEGTGKLLEGAGGLAGTLALGETLATKAGWLQKTSPAARFSGRASYDAPGPAEPTTRLYHGGALRGERVQTGRFSTTPDAAHALRYAAVNGGRVYVFEVPTSRVQQLRFEGGAMDLRDLLVGSGNAAPELRFIGKSSEELNQYLVGFLEEVQ